MTQPTHDEVIAWFNTKLAAKKALIIDLEKMVSEYGDDSPSSKELLKEANEDYASLLANRDVLDRHKPIPLMGGSLLPDFQCADGCGNFPCPTYQDIYNRIREVM